jgi:prevent-host-death family protein
MASLRQRSRTRSAANLAQRDTARLASLTFFVDRQFGRFIVPEALRAAGAKVEAHDDHFAQNTPDVEWLTQVGKRGWVVISKDQNIRRNPLELAAYEAAKVLHCRALIAMITSTISIEVTTMIREAPAMTVRQNLGELLNEVQYRHGKVLITKAGKPVAALVDIAMFTRLRKLDEEFGRMRAELAQAFAGMTEKAVEALVGEAVKDVRARRRKK